jgi:uncharacterized membrane protein (UPF0182 family)
MAVGALGQAVPLYTDWLWFKEVGFTQVFTTRLALNGWLFLGLGGVVFAFLFLNLSVAARTAPPDVLWELEDQLGLPGRAVLEPLVRRLLLPVIGVIALFAGARGSGAWDTVLSYVNATPFGRTDPLFGRDLGFFVFELPIWRLVYGWATASVPAAFSMWAKAASILRCTSSLHSSEGTVHHAIVAGCLRPQSIFFRPMKPGWQEFPGPQC